VNVRQPILVSVTSLLIFDDEVSTGQNVISRSVTSFLSFSDQAIKTALILTASNHLHLSHEVDTRKFHEKPSSILYFSHVATVEQTSPATSNLEFEQLLYCHIVKSPSLTDNLVFTQEASAVIQDKSQWTGAPTLVRRTTTVLTWPYDSPVLTIEIPVPEFNNQEKYNTRRVNRKSRGGTLDIFRDPSWPSVRNFDFSFEWLTDDQRYAMLDFLDRSLGEEIGMLDFESRQWRGIILTPSSEIADAGPSKHGIEIAFEGDLV
jgi:hypothetical protein